MFAEAHQAEAVGDHDQDHAHIFGKREQQFMEVFGINSRVAGVKVRSLQQAADDQGDICIECLFHFIQRDDLFQDRAVEQESDDRCTLQSDLCSGDQRCVDIA